MLKSCIIVLEQDPVLKLRALPLSWASILQCNRNNFCSKSNSLFLERQMKVTFYWKRKLTVCKESLCGLSRGLQNWQGWRLRMKWVKSNSSQCYCVCLNYANTNLPWAFLHLLGTCYYALFLCIPLKICSSYIRIFEDNKGVLFTSQGLP